MSDMNQVIVPKSDQLNSDDLIGGARTIKITSVSVRPGTEQPVSICYHGDNGRPYKPCKSMMRVMVAAWGNDSANYVGRSMTLYRDPSVKWGGMEVGGIRISHMSHIERPMSFALTATRGVKKGYKVEPLKQSPAESAAQKGLAAYQEYFKGIAAVDRKALIDSGEHERLKQTAMGVDAASAPPIDATKIHTAHDAGRAAALNGLSRTDCPADLSPSEREAWLAWFNEAEEEANGSV